MSLNENLILKIIVRVTIFISLALYILLSFVHVDDYSKPINGFVSTNPYPYKIKSQVSAEIKELPVKEGNNVLADQILLQLDDNALKIELDSLKKKKEYLNQKIIGYLEKKEILAERLILNKEYEKNLIKRLSSKKSFVENKKELSEVSKSYVGSIKDDAKKLIQQLDKNNKQLLSKVKELDIRTQAHNVIERGLSYEKERASIQYENELASLEFADSQYQLGIENRNIDYEINQVSQELLDLNSTLDDVKSKIEQLKIKLTHTTVLAPISGVITSVEPSVLTSNTITANETLVTLVPEGAKLIGVLALSDEDYRQIKVGQKVNLEFFAWNHYKYGILKGTVEKVSVGKISHPVSGRLGHFAEVNLDNRLDVEIGYSFRARVLWEKVPLYKYILKKMNIDNESESRRG
ncbi:HlyD family secretion protein [Aliikangiella sp. G2MR2-5]|uniref:HlyD family secretion protein n=1 Tax=Aliikangiella sp. G2MR2-5 TaxID=2788943 RepID=UPI0018AC7FA2|nr:HlyD family efflux transporter periplasmic adaptor subunit [Aliikangiella sp. G2MR2-5]